MSANYCQLTTIGYEGLTIEDFIKKLLSNNVDILIDVRELPWSRKNGFSKNKLAYRLSNKPIKYFNFPELGSPQPARNQLREDADYEKFFSIYSEYIDEYKESLIDILSLLRKKSVCLMCFENNVNCCHRKILVEKIQKMSGKLKVKHL